MRNTKEKKRIAPFDILLWTRYWFFDEESIVTISFIFIPSAIFLISYSTRFLRLVAFVRLLTTFEFSQWKVFNVVHAQLFGRFTFIESDLLSVKAKRDEKQSWNQNTVSRMM